MSKCDHEHKVCESHKRTLLKGVTAKVLEVSFDLVIFSSVLSQYMPPQLAILDSLGISIMIESFCFGLGYLNERLWNKVQWGRKVIDIIDS
jgi:hypothetical protein